MKKIIVLILLVALTIMSCKSNDIYLENRKWFLHELEGETNIIVIDEKKPFIEFDLESSKVGGYSTCNNFFTEYTIMGNSIEIGEIATTLMACVEDTKQEYRFLQALSRVDSISLEVDKLSMFEGDRKILIFISEL